MWWTTLPRPVQSVPGVYLLDRTSDASHNRSVLTLAGHPDGVFEAMDRAVAVAIDEIDMTRHSGVHPRIGAIDVVPFVPLAEATMADCIALARRFGARLGERYGLPVYLYARAAVRPERVKLADVRHGQFEGLQREIHEPGRQPDFGPGRMHPTAGAVAVGARPFLIAYNINLGVSRSSSWRAESPVGSASRVVGSAPCRQMASGSRTGVRRRSR